MQTRPESLIQISPVKTFMSHLPETLNNVVFISGGNTYSFPIKYLILNATIGGMKIENIEDNFFYLENNKKIAFSSREFEISIITESKP